MAHHIIMPPEWRDRAHFERGARDFALRLQAHGALGDRRQRRERRAVPRFWPRLREAEDAAPADRRCAQHQEAAV